MDYRYKYGNRWRCINTLKIMNAYIKDIAYYLPDEVLSNAIIEKEFPEWNVEKIAQKTGIENRHIASENETSGDLAVKAANLLFEKKGIRKEDINFILLCTQSPDFLLPTTACIVQNRLGLKTNIGALDFNLGCSGYVYGLGLAKGLIGTKQAKNVLLITAETYSKYIHPRDKSNRTIFGDAASATLISGEDGALEIMDSVYGTDGSGAENLIVRNGGLRNFNKTSEVTVDENGNHHSDSNLYMNGGNVFTFTLSSVPGLIENVLDKNSLTSQDVDLYIFHQANKFMLEALRKKIKIPNDKFYLFLKDCGNTVSSTIPIALHHAMVEDRIKGSSKVLLAGFGVGYSWGGTILKMR